MDHLGAHHLQQSHAEPISFGIDQILNNPDQGSCMISGARLQDAADYGLGGGCVVSSAYNAMTGHYGAAAGGGGSTSAGGYGSGGGACSMASLAGSYNMNLGVGAMNGNNLNAAGGVIRVPAHRPLTGGVHHQPLSTGMPTVPSVNNLTGLTFPWMESNRRYTKDRFTGEWVSLPPPPALPPCAPLASRWRPPAPSLALPLFLTLPALVTEHPLAALQQQTRANPGQGFWRFNGIDRLDL